MRKHIFEFHNIMSTSNKLSRSCLATIVPYFKLSPLVVLFGYLDRAFGLYLPTFNLIMKYTYGDEFAATGKNIYRKHCLRVRQKMLDTHREANYLEFNVKEGWEPLCKFLDRPVPTNVEGRPKPFPRVNDRTVFGEIFDERLAMLLKRMIWMGVACLIPTVAILGGSWWRSFNWTDWSIVMFCYSHSRIRTPKTEIVHFNLTRSVAAENLLEGFMLSI